MKIENDRKEELLNFMKKHEEIKSMGFAGILPNGNLVDRREYPDALPLQYNPMLNIPKPHLMPGLKEAREAIKKIPNTRIVWDEKDQRWAFELK